MKMRKFMLAVPVGLLALTFTQAPVAGGAFQAKYYKECYQPVAALIKASEPEKDYIGGPPVSWYPKYDKEKGSGIYFSAETRETKDRHVIKNVAAFKSKMIKENPEPNARFNAYSHHISQEADDLGKIEIAVEQSQDCYQKSYQSLSMAYKNNRIGKKEAVKSLKEIQKGTKISGEFLKKATHRMRINIAAYAEALNDERHSLGISLSSARKMAGLAEQMPSEGYSPVGTFTNLAEFSTIRTWQSADLTVKELTAISPAAGGDVRLSKEEKMTRMMLPGLQRVGVASVQFLNLRGDILTRTEAQRALERQVAVVPW